ncbi:CAAX farnesyltransferase (FTase) subunit beta [Coemansia sp. RSA 2611]|nr:CAAX farnesyltransferase (FTase) subunit beta [Coemansia sp. RSA 2705]KAJ2365427.1 CAAX farnesyltransferase (FTase) subunit beta [Coemansia sp. RSA 2610]KAJ2393381.1 CAAX farnesyltransferase (FTase) subunit beta [Coemansia sp. RSA 2611]
MSHTFSYHFRYDDNAFETETSVKQIDVEDSIGRIYAKFVDPRTAADGGVIDDSRHRLMRSKHEQFVRDALHGLSSGFAVLDASQPWLSFWSLNSLDIMNCEIDLPLRQRAFDTVKRFQDSDGGYCGGYKQLPHMAGTYASIMALVLVGGDEAFQTIDREAMYRWLMTMKQPDGSFAMHTDGEVDVRGVYCAMVIASLLNIMTPELIAGSAEFVAQCQTCEGGIGPFPGVEAHGGYTLCGLAALEILGKTELLNLGRLARWMCARQLAFEGGFNGRTNKLVDGCYSYWVGGAFPILQKALERSPSDDYLYERVALQRYVLACCQEGRMGGLRDKPGKSADLYHTMYGLLGLSLSQHYMGVDPEAQIRDTTSIYSVPARMMQWDSVPVMSNVLGAQSNMLKPVHPVYGVSLVPLAKCVKYFYSLPSLAASLS